MGAMVAGVESMNERAAAFEQSLDVCRPHTLLTLNTKRSGQLLYRYDDSGELIRVPNVWYNQTADVRAAAVRWDAAQQFRMADEIEARPPLDMTRSAAAQIAARYRERGRRIEGEARRMEAASRAGHPVEAARMAMDYGPNVVRR